MPEEKIPTKLLVAKVQAAGEAFSQASAEQLIDLRKNPAFLQLRRFVVEPEPLLTRNICPTCGTTLDNQPITRSVLRDDPNLEARTRDPFKRE